MEGGAYGGEYAVRQGCTLDRARALEATPRAQARTHVETHGMSRYKDLALRLAVVASFVLVLAAPFRW
jgi:hypothetical protein